MLESREQRYIKAINDDDHHKKSEQTEAGTSYTKRRVLAHQRCTHRHASDNIGYEG